MNTFRRELSSFVTSIRTGETSREFFDLIKQVAATKSKQVFLVMTSFDWQDEAALISEQIAYLKRELKKNARDLNWTSRVRF
jgi:hypothetical protein